ncbi:RND family transporter [Candidatus Omnitrophota bacterium]
MIKRKITRFVHWFSHGLIRYRNGFLILCIAISLFFAYQLKDLSFETNLGDFYPLRHPYLQIQNRLNDVFGGLNQVSISIEVKKGTILNPETLNKVWQITQELYLTEGINAGRVVSLSARKVKYIEADDEGFVTDWMMHDPPQGMGQVDELRQRILRSPMVYGPIVSEDFKATMIQADFESDVSARKIFRILQGVEERYRDNNHKIHISGQPVLQGWLDYYLPRMTRLSAITILVMSLALWFAFKSKRGVFLPLISAFMSTLWGLGLISLFGYKLTPSTMLAPFLVFALGVSHSVQFIKLYYEYMSKHKYNSKAAAIYITRVLFVPGFTGLFTDGIAPFALLAVPLMMVRSLAVAIGFGILSIFFTTIILVPNLLSFMHPPKRLEVIKEERTTLTNKILAYFAKLAINKRSRWTVILIFFALTGVALFGTSLLRVGDKKPGTSLLYSNSPYNKAEKFNSEKFATADPYYIFVEGRDEDALVSTEVLKEMDSLQRYLEQEVEGVGRSLSLVEYIKGMNMVMFSGQRREFKIPDKEQTVAEYLFLYSLTGFPGDFDPVVNYNYKFANIKVDLRDHKTETIDQVIEKTEEWIKQNHKTELADFSYAGGSIGMTAAVNEIVETMLPRSSLTTTFLVFLCLMLAYGSFVAGWLLIIPLFFRTLLVFGILGFMRVGMTAEMIPMVALGIGFGDDFGLYIVSRVQDVLREGGGALKDALVEAMSTSGKAVFFTGLTLTIGIATWMFSDILMQARLGALLAFFIFFNAIGTLIVLPSMIMTVKPKFLKR